MKQLKIFMLFCMGALFLASNAIGQNNPYTNVLPLNSGVIAVGANLDLQITVGNTGSAAIPFYKLRPVITVPSAIVTILPNAQQTGLPAGWSIVSNDGIQIRICNGTDAIPASTARNFVIKVVATAVGGPSAFSSQITFGSATTCANSGPAVPGNSLADDNSNSNLTVITASPCTLTASASAGTIACFGGTTTLTATIAGASTFGTPEYSIDGINYQSANTFTVNGSASPYTVSVREQGTVCTATAAPVTISVPTAIVATATNTNNTSNTTPNGTATVTASGGAGGFTYLWAPGGQTTATATGLAGGTYTVTVTDANGCTKTATTTVVTVLPCTITVTAAASPVAIACFGGTITLTATATGASGAVQYSLNGGAYQSGNTFTVPAGTYTVTAREVATPSCNATSSSVTVSQPAAALAASSVAGTITCGAATAVVTVSATGGTAPYTGTGTFNRPVGPYSLTVTDANGCTAVTTGTVTSTPDAVNPTITAPAALSVNTNDSCKATNIFLGTPVTADNCGVASVTNNAPLSFPLGNTTVTWTVTDNSGNTATATQVVTVTDNIKPVIYFQPSALVAGASAPGSSQTSYLLPLQNGVKFTSMLSVNDAPGGYRMAGIPDGLGAFDNNNGTFTLLMNHEIGSTLGVTRAHGAIGSFVSRWIVNKSNLSVVSGSDLMTSVLSWNNTLQATGAPITFAFNRFCSGDLPSVSAYYNKATGLGSQARIYMHGEEGGATGYQVATVASGPDAGKAYILGKFNLTTNGSGLTGLGAWENALANPFPQNKTIVIGNNDGGTGIMNNSVCVYEGTKTNTGSEVDKAGLTNGTLKFVNVAGSTTEIVNTTTRATNITSGTAFTLSGTSSTAFSRPEDGVWNPLNPSQYFFVTTDQYNQVGDGVGTQIGRSRLWRLNFTDITNPSLGGTIDLLLNGTEGHTMFDNLSADKTGHLILLEDVGNQQHNGKMWQYTLSNGNFIQLAKHDGARFGDVGIPATSPYNQDEEMSGVIDMAEILGPGMHLVVDQAHYNTGLANVTEVVEGGQLLAFFNPASIQAAALTAAADTINACTGIGIVLGTPATADNCSVASVTNNAPATFPVGNTTVTWTVTDGSGNTATANQIVVVSNLAATSTFSAIACNGGNSTVTVSATGGKAPYTGTGTFTRPAGPYTYTVTDANGCSVVTTGTIAQPASIVVSATAPLITSFGGTTTVTVSATGGTAPYTGTGAFVRTAGTYTFTVTDANGCIGTQTITIAAFTTPTVADPAVGQIFFANTSDVLQSANTLLFPPVYKLKVPFYNLNQTNVVPNGSIQVKVNLGSKLNLDPAFTLATAPLSAYFAWTSAVVVDSVIITGTQIAAIPADFNAELVFNVKGKLSCTSNVTARILIINTGAPVNDEDLQNNNAVLQYTLPVTLTTTQVNVTCNGANNGIINVVASPGTVVVIKNASNVVVSNTNLAPGTYTITATATGDAPLSNVCSSTATVTIVQPLVLVSATSNVLNNLCNGGNTGSFTASSTGGTAPYTYLIAGPTVNATGATTGVFAFLLAGTYTITSTDANGCTATTTATIGQPTGTAPDVSLGSDISGTLFLTNGLSKTIVYNITEIAGNPAVGDTIRITNPSGFTINFNSALAAATVGSTTYILDNSRWKVDYSNPAFTSIILTDPSNASNPGTLLCNQRLNVSVTLTRNTTNISTFTLSARFRRANGELNLNNNLNSIIFTAE